ncbi:MAG: hypothetical protein NXI35_34660 [bacterium]|nr:hypothetical protein [bacterium]
MTNPDFAALVRGIEPLRACFIVEAASGALHREFTRGPMPVEPAAVARAVAGLARAQTDIVGLAEPATLCTLEWPSVRVIVRSVSASALVIFFFEADTKLGVARMHITNIVDELDALLPSTRPQTMRAMPSVAAPADVEPSPAPEPEPEPAPEPAPATSPSTDPSSSRGQRLLAYLDENAPDTHAALLRVSLQTGLPLSLLKSPEKLSGDEFEQVTASVRRILGVEQLPL